MVTLPEIVCALAGIGRLIRFDRRGLTYFDQSIQGFWRSFSVALLVAPLHAVLIPHRLEATKPTVGWLQVTAIEILTYMVFWLLYPAVAFEMCRWLKRHSEYPGYIAVYNWSSILFIATQVLAWLPSMTGFTTTAFSENLHTAAYCAMQVYWWFIAREALKIDGVVAVGFVFVNFVLMLLLSALHFIMLRPSI